MNELQIQAHNVINGMRFLGGLSLKPSYSITHGKLQLAIWDTSF